MASLAPLISSLKPQPINPSSHKLLGFNYLSTQLTLKLSPTHQPFYSTTRPSKNFTTAASYSYQDMPIIRKSSTKQREDNIDVELCVLAINEQDPVNSAGNLVPISNNIYTAGNRKKLLGITSGVCVLKEKNGNLYEAKYDLHFEKYGHVSVEGQCSKNEDAYLEVTGRSGIFEGVKGTVKLQHIKFPVQLSYTFNLKGIKNLPAELMD